MTSQVVRSSFEFESTDSKVLSFGVDELFLVIKVSKPADWLYVVNTMGRLGYIPSNYIRNDEIDDNELLPLIDSIATQLDAKHNNSDAITDRQVKHAQIKLAQLRCEVVQKIFKKNHPEVIPEVDVNNSDCDLSPDAKNHLQPEEDINASDKTSSTRNGDNYNSNKKGPEGIDDEKLVKDHTIPQDANGTNNNNNINCVKIPDILIPELIERVRVSTDLNHGMCTLAVKTVIQCLAERIPAWSKDCEEIIKKLAVNDTPPNAIVLSSDYVNLKSIFKRLWCCKNDEQQRSWPVHEDEDIIKSTLEELVQILSNANPAFIKEVICKDNYENVHMLVTYFQMETRRSLRMKLYSVFLCLISLFEKIIPDYLLTSVLPAELAAEMQNYIKDEERWSSAALLFTAIFSTGHKPPINIYEHINEKFIIQQLDVIEGIDADGNKIESNISAESSIAPILSFNLHLDQLNNIVLNALKTRRNASQLTENLVSYLNWEEDITKVCPSMKESDDDLSGSHDMPNSSLKLLIEMFGDPVVSKLFYYNDVRVVIDIILRQLNNLPAGDKARASYLILASNIIKNTSYNEEPHKLDDLCRSLKSIEHHECSTERDLQLVSMMKAEHPILMN